MNTTVLSTADKAIEILHRTQDGEKLEAKHLKLTELAVNGFLNEEGMHAFDALYESVTNGTYAATPHWFHGIENLTQKPSGYVYWKGICVEHYSHTDPEASKRDAEDLAVRCRSLETKGFPVTWGNLLRRSLLEAPANTPWLLPMQRNYCFFESNHQEEGGTAAAVVVGIFHREGKDAGVVVVSPAADGSFRMEVMDDAYTAFHAVQSRGFICMQTDPCYTELVLRFENLGASPELLIETIAAVA